MMGNPCIRFCRIVGTDKSVHPLCHRQIIRKIIGSQGFLIITDNVIFWKNLFNDSPDLINRPAVICKRRRIIAKLYSASAP